MTTHTQQHIFTCILHHKIEQRRVAIDARLQIEALQQGELTFFDVISFHMVEHSPLRSVMQILRFFSKLRLPLRTDRLHHYEQNTPIRIYCK